MNKISLLVHESDNKFRIESIWAFVSVDENGLEGVCAHSTAVGMLPLITARPDLLPALRKMAEEIARHSGKQIKVIRMHSREEIETIKL